MRGERPQPGEAFGFTHEEQLYERINHKRFLALLTDQETNVHHIDVSTNSFGEFLFVTMSRAVGEERSFLTFWGAGLHELRERWLTNEWRFYETQQFTHQIPQKIAPEDAQALVEARLDEIAPYVTTTQSKRARLYELLADMTDEDGALTELEDLGWPDEDLD